MQFISCVNCYRFLIAICAYGRFIKNIYTPKIDDDIAGDARRRERAIRNITKVADTSDMTRSKKTRILEHVRFFAQYDERDGSQPREGM